MNKLISNVTCVSSVLLNAIYQYKLSEGKVIAKKTDGSGNYSYSQQNPEDTTPAAACADTSPYSPEADTSPFNKVALILAEASNALLIILEFL